MSEGLSITADKWDPSMLNAGTTIHGANISMRLDASESVFFQRELEFIDTQDYQTLQPANLARRYIPTQGNIPDWARQYTFRMYDKFGKARIIGNSSDDLPRSDVDGAEKTKNIKFIGAAYGWDIFEIRAAAKTGRRLDNMRAMAARFSIDDLIDDILAKGLPDHNLDGLLTLSSVSTVTPTTKTGGGTNWDQGTPDEIAQDLFKLVTTIITGLKQAGAPGFYNFTLLLPVDKHAKIAQERMGDGSDTTILQFVLKNSPYISAIEPWHQCTGAGAGATDRIIAYPRNPLVVAGIVPMEMEQMPPMQRNLEYVVNVVASCGGVVVRYPVAMRYMDGI